jgi:metal-responsive CopG/Arc/MetJ family transcriptional regulator
MSVLSIRIDEAMLADVDQLVEESKQIGVPVSRAEIVRRALRIGLAALLRKRNRHG